MLVEGFMRALYAGYTYVVDKLLLLVHRLTDCPRLVHLHSHLHPHVRFSSFSFSCWIMYWSS